jgi:hypothetical protein
MVGFQMCKRSVGVSRVSNILQGDALIVYGLSDKDNGEIKLKNLFALVQLSGLRQYFKTLFLFLFLLTA